MELNTYESRLNFVKNKVLGTVGNKESYIVSDVFARFSIYLIDDSVELIQALQGEVGDYVERIESIEHKGFIHRDLNNPNVKPPESLSANGQKVYFVDRHINLINWSIINNKFKNQSPITCFYSFKGGLGRTTALLLTGIAQARQGKKVVLIDFDLEAPGLSNFLTNDFDGLNETRGVVDFLVDYSNVRNIDKIDFNNYYFAINQQDIVGSNGGELFIIPAGYSTTENIYMSKFSKLNSVFNSGSSALIDDFLSKVQEKLEPDSILIDTRTGLNDWGGLLISRYAKYAFLFFYGSSQNMFGLETLLPELLSQDELEFYLVNSPIPKIKELAEQEKGYYLDFAYDIYSKYYYNGNEPFIGDETAPHYPIEIYHDDLAILLNSSEKIKNLLDRPLDTNPYLKMANLIDSKRKHKVSSIADNQEENNEKQSFLEAIKSIVPDLAAGEYEFGNLNNLTKYFYPRKDYRFIFDKNKYLILGEKGAGKTALYAVLNIPEYAKKLGEFCDISSQELDSTEWIKGLDNTGNFPEKSLFSLIGKKDTTSQRIFWKKLIINQLKKESTTSWVDFSNSLSLINEIELDEEFRILNEEYKTQTVVKTLVYDYLDLLIPEENKIRGKLISVLLDIWRNIYNRYPQIRCKIFLRKDIFDREVNITDKVKFNNHSAEIKWEYDQLLNVIWKRIWHQAKDSVSLNVFHNWFSKIDSIYLGEVLGMLPKANEEDNRMFLDRLIGEYMGGNNKAFPYNWILYHISDTQRNIHPRSLLNLFSEASKLQLEKEDFQFEYFLRPRYLEYASKTVSEIRVADIKEEYPSIASVFDRLHKFIERMPVLESDLNEALENLIKEQRLTINFLDLKTKLEDIGVLYEYKYRRKGAEKKYHIPDLYLIGMGLKRVGPGAHKALFGKK